MQPVDTEARGGGRIRKGSVGRMVATGRNDSLERPSATLIGAALWPLFAGVRPSFLPSALWMTRARLSGN